MNYSRQCIHSLLFFGLIWQLGSVALSDIPVGTPGHGEVGILIDHVNGDLVAYSNGIPMTSLNFRSESELFSLHGRSEDLNGLFDTYSPSQVFKLDTNGFEEFFVADAFEPEIVFSQIQEDLTVTGSLLGGAPLTAFLVPLGPPNLLGDFDGSNTLDVHDINALNLAILNESTAPQFDLTNDGIVDGLDRVYWVHQLKSTSFGDANLDGVFDASDLVQVFQLAQYEDDIRSNSNWESGDWNGDLDFTSSDLVVAYQDLGYADAAVVATVPEPTVIFNALALLVVFYIFRNFVS